MSVNKFIGIGNLGQQAESRQVRQSLVIKFSIAMTERFKDQTGQQQSARGRTWSTGEARNPAVPRNGSAGVCRGFAPHRQVAGPAERQWRSATKVRARTVHLLEARVSRYSSRINNRTTHPQQGYRQQGQANYAQPQQQYAQQPAYQPQQARPRPAARPQPRSSSRNRHTASRSPNPSRCSTGRRAGEGDGDLPF